MYNSKKNLPPPPPPVPHSTLFGGLVGLLYVSEPKLRGRFYEEAGVLGAYLPDSRSVDIEADPCVRKVRVGGGT